MTDALLTVADPKEAFSRRMLMEQSRKGRIQ